MTAEIAILNKEAIALAADSAVTMTGPSGEKVFTSANKLFALSKYHPVGIMIYGNALFMNIPWETIIKIYREKLGTKSFPAVEDYGADFIDFLTKSENIFSDATQEIYFKNTIYSYLNFIKKEIQKNVEKELEKKGKISEEDIKKIIGNVIHKQYELWKNSGFSPNISEDFHKRIIKKYKEEMNTAIKNILEKLPLSSDDTNKLTDTLTFLFYRTPENIERTGISGVVMAGFGDDEVFPSLIEYKMDGILEGTLKYKRVNKVTVDFQTGAVIIPFAQKDMIQLFMEGIYPDYLAIEHNYLRKLFEDIFSTFAGNIKIEKTKMGKDKKKLNRVIDSIVEDFMRRLSEYRKNTYTAPIMRVVSLLPKSELAMMAETLVNLTSLKRKWSTERETVGGPIDVALISKGDGFIWIKRKHYFNPELNPYFFEKYYMEVKK